MPVWQYVVYGLTTVITFFLLSFIINWLFRVDKRQRNRTIIQISHQPPKQDDLRETIRGEKSEDEDTNPQGR